MRPQFLAAEILRMGESLKYPMREPHGIQRLPEAARVELREKFLEYSMELAERVRDAPEPPSDRISRR